MHQDRRFASLKGRSRQLLSQADWDLDPAGHMDWSETSSADVQSVRLEPRARPRPLARLGDVLRLGNS
jgi:hypothetical protein